MSFLLDTNVVSEWIKPEPHPGVIAWLASAEEEQVFLSVVTLAELRQGIARMAAGIRRDRLDQWLRTELPSRFGQRLLSIDAAVADAWGMHIAFSFFHGRPMQGRDAFLAATASEYGLTLVTRNVSDFSVLGLPVFNPWA